MDPSLLYPHPTNHDEDRSLTSPATSFGEPNSSWDLQHAHSSSNDTSSSFEHSSDDITQVLGTLVDSTPWSVRKAAATAGRIVIPPPALSGLSSTTGPTTGSPPSSRFSAWSTGSCVYGRESPRPELPGGESNGEAGTESEVSDVPEVRPGLLTPGSPLLEPPLPSADVRTLHKTLSAEWGEARELGLTQRELSPKPVSRNAELRQDETAGEGADGEESEPGAQVPSPASGAVDAASGEMESLSGVPDFSTEATVSFGPSTGEPVRHAATPPPSTQLALDHRNSLAPSDATDESCPFFYSPPPLQSNFVRSVKESQASPPCVPTDLEPPIRPSPAPLDLSLSGSRPGARTSYAFPDPSAFGREPAPLSAPIPTYPPLHPGLLRRSSSMTSASDSGGSDGSGTRSFGWVQDLYDLYSPAGEGEDESVEVGRLDLAGEGEGGGRFADEGASEFESPGFRIWRDEESFSSEPGTAPAMQSVFAALQALAAPMPAGSEYEGSFVTACSSARASPRHPSPLGSPLPDAVRLALTGQPTTGDNAHLRRIGSNTSLLLEPPSPRYSGRALPPSEARDVEAELVAARGDLFGLENEVHHLRSQLAGARAGEGKAARTARWAEELRGRVEVAERELEVRRERARVGGEREIDEMLAELGVDLTVSSALFLSPQVAFLPTCPHCHQPVQTTRLSATETEASPAAVGPLVNGGGVETGNDAAPDDDEPNLDAWVTTHLACLPHITELLAFVQEPEVPGDAVAVHDGGMDSQSCDEAGEMGSAI